jgi:hypothetical protein
MTLSTLLYVLAGAFAGGLLVGVSLMAAYGMRERPLCALCRRQM